MPKALFQGQVIAESDAYELVEGNVYLPPGALRREFFRESPTTSVCPWKGTARYYTIAVGAVENRDAAWYYPAPKEKAVHIKDHVAFWRGVEVRR